MAWAKGNGQRGRTNHGKVPGTRNKGLGALTAVAGALRETAVESAKDGINAASEKIGKVAGGGLAVAATGVVDAMGYHPSPLIAVGAAFAGMKMGGLVGKGLTAGLDKISGGHGGGPIGTVMVQLSAVLQTLDQLGRSVSEVVDSVNKAQTHYQRVGKGAGNNFLLSAVRHCRRAPEHFEDAMAEVRQAQESIGAQLVKVATAGK
jgi:hypothetical protein